MADHITDHRGALPWGTTTICEVNEQPSSLDIGLAIHRQQKDEPFDTCSPHESAWLLMHGKATVHVDGETHTLERSSLFDQSPSCIHLPAHTQLRVECQQDTEWTVYTTHNAASFAPRVFLPAQVKDERRGEHQVGGACFRLVRTIFDNNNSAPETNLVLGEVITLPGRWSSYPPHHHPQPEIYHYRFAQPAGFGHAELGEQVFKVRHGDTIKIAAGLDHAQAAAPGYAMYYSWVIRHLPKARYTVPEFTQEHAWTLAPEAQLWHPADE